MKQIVAANGSARRLSITCTYTVGGMFLSVKITYAIVQRFLERLTYIN